MRKDGVNPNMLIFGSEAANILLQNERYMKLLDNRRLEIGEICPGGQKKVDDLDKLADVRATLCK